MRSDGWAVPVGGVALQAKEYYLRDLDVQWNELVRNCQWRVLTMRRDSIFEV